MERLVTVRVMAERYGCSAPTARRYIRQIEPHMEKPLATFDWALREWEESRTVHVPGKRHRTDVQHRGRVIVPRTRKGV